MKSYFAAQQFCLVGKAWEVRHYLRKLVASSAEPKQPLLSLLEVKYNASTVKQATPIALVLQEEVE